MTGTLTFIQTLTHPNHKALAMALMNGVSRSSLVPIYGKTRVQSMSKRIKYWKPGDTGSKALPCEHCFSDIRGLCKIQA